jgi:hypothetical protein
MAVQFRWEKRIKDTAETINNKNQIPNKFQITISKFQIRTKSTVDYQLISPIKFGIFIFVIVIYLSFGAWLLLFVFSHLKRHEFQD